MIYFTSDFHFGHEIIIELERISFPNINTHDNAIMDILEQLSSSDVLYFLGDLGWPDEEITKRLKSLACKKYMIIGNHDKYKVESYETNYGFKVYKYPIWISKRVVLSHYPIPVEEGVVNIHGHLHNSILDMENYVNANIHMQQYKLVNEKQIDILLSRLKKPSKKFLEEWYAGHQKYSPQEVARRSDIIFSHDGIALAKKERLK